MTTNLLSRRNFIQIGFAGGLSLSDSLRLQAANKPKATSLIHIYLPGGMAHQESWDHKPNATAEYKGPLGKADTKIQDVFFSELFKETANVSDQLTVIRSMTHGEAAHERGTHNMLTGYRPSPALKYPSYGSIVSHELGVKNNIPPYIVVPNSFAPENGSGYLSNAFGPFSVGSNPEDPNFTVRDLQQPKDITNDRFDRRKSLLSSVNEHFEKLEKSDALNAVDSFYHQAYNLISSTSAREAFNLKNESEIVKNKYGNNSAGMRLLLAKRLIEAGTRLVTVTYGGWDHHSNIKQAMTSNVLNFDKAFAALITDLKESGLLDTTIVLVSSEFGRTPKINQSNGRDHYPSVFSVVMAGGGIKKQFAHGSSNSLASEPETHPTSPEDLSATIFHLLGINPAKKLVTSDMRPIEISQGHILTNIIS